MLEGFENRWVSRFGISGLSGIGVKVCKIFKEMKHRLQFFSGNLGMGIDRANPIGRYLHLICAVKNASSDWSDKTCLMRKLSPVRRARKNLVELSVMDSVICGTKRTPVFKSVRGCRRDY